jgi:hypothetical protein
MADRSTSIRSKYIIVNALYIAYIKRFYIANDKAQLSVVRRKAAFVSWLSVLSAPSWCERLRCFGDDHLLFRLFGELLFFACKSEGHISSKLLGYLMSYLFRL